MMILNRSSNSINIATFWENYDLKKYNFSPVYQREGDVWSEMEKSYLIDTILKNFPMPPIFLHQHIDNDTGKTVYDVVDGKQRLTAIISFLKNEISVPENFSEDSFGDEKLSGLFFKEFDNPDLSDWKKILWKYEITIEYIETDDKDVVNHIFDRLNRNGQPLTNQELRKAQYGNSLFYGAIAELSALPVFSTIVSKLKSNRLEHHEFITELLFLISEDKILAGDKPSEIDDLYGVYSKYNEEKINTIKENFQSVVDNFKSFNLNSEEYKYYGVSHIYGLWGLAWKLWKEKIKIPNVDSKLNNFYSLYKQKGENEFVKNYRITMSAGTKGASRRNSRIESLYSFVTKT
jgi:Protein of unknown function DUF262